MCTLCVFRGAGKSPIKAAKEAKILKDTKANLLKVAA